MPPIVFLFSSVNDIFITDGKLQINLDKEFFLIIILLIGGSMREVIKDSFLVGLGIVALGRKKISKIYHNLKTEGEALKNEIPVIKRRWQKFETFSERMETIGQRIADRLNIATKSEISELNKKIEKLLKQKSITE